ncbi:MAG: hypothetical protein AAF806_16115 [Bacteroidota bacterium]
MKKYIALAFSLLFIIQLATAQQNAALQQELDGYTQTYQLNETQQKQVQQMLETKYFNLTELEDTKSSNAELYEQKTANLERQTLMGVKSILSETQLVIYKQVREQKRQLLRQKIETLKASGEDKAALSKAIAELKTMH